MQCAIKHQSNKTHTKKPHPHLALERQKPHMQAQLLPPRPSRVLSSSCSIGNGGRLALSSCCSIGHGGSIALSSCCSIGNGGSLALSSCCSIGNGGSLALNTNQRRLSRFSVLGLQEKKNNSEFKKKNKKQKKGRCARNGALPSKTGRYAGRVQWDNCTRAHRNILRAIARNRARLQNGASIVKEKKKKL